MLTDIEVSNMAVALGISFEEMCNRISGFPVRPKWVEMYATARTNEKRYERALTTIINEIQDQVPRLTDATAFEIQGDKIVRIAKMALKDRDAEVKDE